MKKVASTFAALALAGVIEVSFGSAAFAHNRAHVILPSGACMIVGSEKSVTLPGGGLLDLRPETTPAVTDGPIPKGNPTATTSSPGFRRLAEPRVAAGRSSGMLRALITARSFSGWTLTRSASDSVPS